MNIISEIQGFLDGAVKPLIVILGPTGCGKTDLSLRLASQFNGEIINADSRQIYRGMDIGTNKIATTEMGDIPHHLLSFKNPDEVFTAAEYKKEAVESIKDILKRKKIPFLVGGTGLYINAVCLNYDIPAVIPNLELRKELEDLQALHGGDYLHQRLTQVDPEEAKKHHPHQLRYIMRALEIALSGKKKSVIARKSKPIFDCFFIGIDVPREVLFERLDARVEKMKEAGLVEEVKSLLAKGYDEKAHAMNGIGYKEVIPMLRSEISEKEALELIQQNTRHFAKRQMTWFRRLPGVHWITPD